MPPKKSAPSPQSDESDFSDFDGEQVVRKEPSKTAKSQKAGGNKEKVKRNAEEQMEDAANKLFDGSDGEDDDQDLFLLPLPPRPDFLTMPNNSNRLIILNVEVDNFKSYFGKASIGPFHKSFTSIIGPNGSGKSNLIDALLFVFGFRAAKIRSSKVANLIHKSRGREPESCTVTIYFQRIIDLPNQTYKVVDNSKFTISRTAYRNNSSSYAINGRAASKTEVEARLKLVDIDIEHNRFLILQGEVEQIAMMKPVRTNKSETGMVEYLEDIIGSNRLEKFVKLFQRRVNRLTCEQSQQRIAREHARGSKVAMEGQVRTAIEFLSKENEATTMHMKIEQRRRQRYLDKAAPLQAAIEEKKEERQKICVQLDSNKSEYSGMEDQEKKLSKEKSVVDKEIDKLTRELNELSAEETRRKETLKRYKADIQKSEAEKEKEVKKRKQLESVPEKAEKKIEKWKEEVKTLAELEETANAKADENLTKFGKETEKPKEEQKKIQEKWAEINAQYNTVRGEATVARDELEDLKKMATSGTKKLDDLKNRLENSKEKLKREKEEEAKLKPEFAHAEEEVKRLNTEWPSIRNELRAKQQEYARTRDRLEELHQQNKACSSGNRTVQMLMKEKAAGRIPSFIGRLGDQGFVDKKYDAMFSTNYASTLNRLIVGKEEDGAKILDFLHQNKLPRATVQPLDKIKPVGDRLRPAPPDRYPVSRLFDLVECEDELKPAFYDCLHETLAANSIAEAQKLLSHPKCNRNQFCTMDGASISANGNVTGGGRPYYGLIVTDRQKKAKQVTEEDRLEEKSLAEKVEILKRETEELRNVEQRVDKQQCDARRIVAELGPRLGHISSNISMESQAIETLKKTIEKQEKEAGKVKVDQAEIDAKQKIVEELEKQRDELSEQTESVKSRQAEIQSHLDGLFRELVQCHRDEAKDAHSKRTKLEKDMAKEAANSANSGRDIAKCDANIERFDKEIEKKQQMCEGLNENVRSEEDVETKKKTLEEKEEKRKELEKEFETMNNRRSELSEAETKLEEQLKTVNEEMMAMKAKMQDQRARVEDIETKLSGLQLNRIPRFQFLIESTRPEDLDIQLDEEMQVDENQRPEDVEKQKRHMANVISDQVYAMEFGMRQKVLENTETVENIDGPKTVPVELLTEEKVREISDRDAEELQFRVKQCEQQLDVLKQKVDLSCIETYIQKVKHFNEETIKMAVVTDNLRRHNRELQRIKKMRLDEFHSAFEFIGKHLVAVYKMLTDGGDAKLEYIDKDDPFNQGISFMVRPAKKAWKQIQYLSGGEKTLSSLALIFALHMFRPTPFYVMDEIDAALDYRNVSIIAQYVRQKTENAQFIIISLRNNMFELANRLVGIYKVDGCTQNVAIDPLAVCQQAKLISESLGQATCTLPDEVSQRFNDTMSRQTKELTAQEKQYPNFPSSSEISKAEKIVSVEGRVRKELNGTTLGATTSVAGESRAQSKTSERPVSTVRPESRLHQMRIPAPRLVQRASTAAGANASTSISTSLRTSRLERRNESDETTPPKKRINSQSTSSKSPRKPIESPEKLAINASQNCVESP